MTSTSFLEYFGAFSLCFFVVRILSSVIRGCYYSFLGSMLGLTPKFKELGKWAVVTGSTDGIGKAYALELARRGMNIVLISRSPYKLQNVAAEIESEHKVKTKIIDVDFTGGLEIYERVEEELGDLEIGVLVNNVGMSYDIPDHFLDVPDSTNFFYKMIMCNVVSVTMMTKIVMPQMVKRKKGVVLNISSLSGKFQMPLLAVYSATKNFVNFLSLVLSAEYRDSGVIIQSLIPALITTKMSKTRRTGLTVPNPTQYVRAQLRTVGLVDQTTGFWSHSLMVYGMETLQSYFPTSVLISILLRDMKDRRRRVLLRAEREKNKDQ